MIALTSYPSLTPKLNPPFLVDKAPDFAIVISQDCDIVQSTEREPTIEFIVGEKIDSNKVRPSHTYGRNPREIDLELCDPANNITAATFLIQNRVQIPKSDIEHISPSPLTVPDIRQLVRWIAKRYTRVAWPDVFNERLRSVDRKLESLFKQQRGQAVSGILLGVDPQDELAEGSPYKVIAWLTIREDDFDDADLRKQAQGFCERFEELLEECEGLTVEEVELKREGDVSLDDLRLLRKFDRDYRSDAPKPGGSTLPDQP